MPVTIQPQPSRDTGLATIVEGAQAGDDGAWAQLVDRYDATLRMIARSYRLGSADVDDVVQLTWVRMYENIGRLREPRAISGWLATTARREAMRVLQAAVRERLSDDPDLGDAAAGDRPETAVLVAEERAVLRRAVAALPGRQRALLTLLANQPDADYRHIATTLEMPMGSIGPIRARGLARLGRDPELCRHHLDCA